MQSAMINFEMDFKLESEFAMTSVQGSSNSSIEPMDSISTELICHICQKQCKSQGGFTIHLKTHLDSVATPFACLIQSCLESFGSDQELKTHSGNQHPDQYKIRMNGDRLEAVPLKFHCPHCPKRFISNTYLKNHLGVHTNEKPHVCYTCGTKYAKASDLKKHQLDKKNCDLKLNQLAAKQFKCDHCEVFTTTKKHLSVHMNIYHGVKPNVFKANPVSLKCLFCDYVAKTATNLDRHNRSHTGEKPFVCLNCHRGFADKKGLKSHNEKRKCSELPGAKKSMGIEITPHKSREVTPKTKKKTLQIKPKQKPKLKCSKCVQEFSTKAEKQRHENAHGDTHSCPYCSTAFKNHVGLGNHKILAHPELLDTFDCDNCLKAFFTSEALKKHRWECKGKESQKLVQSTNIPLTVLDIKPEIEEEMEEIDRLA